MKPTIAADSISQIHDSLKNLKQRIDVLEGKDRELIEDLEGKDIELIRENKEFITRTEQIKNEIESIKEELNHITKEAISLVKQIQKSAKTEDTRKLERLNQDWMPEEWITREELDKMIQDRVNNK